MNRAQKVMPSNHKKRSPKSKPLASAEASSSDDKRIIEFLTNLGNHLIDMRRKHTETADKLVITKKADGTLLSNADTLSAASIKELLEMEFRNDIVITEEDEFIEELIYERSPSGKIWVVDPIDNTRSFLAGGDDFSVLLTRLDKGKAERCFVFYPSSKKCYVSKQGEGSFEETRKLNVSQTKNLIDANAIEVYTNELGVGNLTAIQESTDAFVAVANGTIDVAFVRLCGHKIWDIAFAVLLIAEAGGAVTDENGNVPMFTSLEAPCGWMIASNGLLHDQAIQHLQKIA